MLKILWFVYLLKTLGIAHISWQFLVITATVLVVLLNGIMVLDFKTME